MKIKNKILTVSLITILAPQALHARDQVRSVGSSTVFPFITTAAEEFGSRSKFKTPIVESTGTGGGFKIFCKGVGPSHPDLSNASRQVKKSEIELCAKNGVKKITELKIGYDGIVIANSKFSKKYDLTKKQLFLSLAKYIPVNGKLVLNPNKTWKDVDAKFPNTKISVYGPPPTSGTRDAFVELVMEQPCKNLPEFKASYPDKKSRKKACHIIREDGSYIESGENDNIIIQKLVKNKTALGIFGYSFLEGNAAKVQASKVEGKEATFENIASGDYPVSRSLFVYVKDAHFAQVASLKPFVKELVSDESAGEYGYLTGRGLIPLTPSELLAEQNKL
jgi:phosphate transport system substrate-binding protein